MNTYTNIKKVSIVLFFTLVQLQCTENKKYQINKKEISIAYKSLENRSITRLIKSNHKEVIVVDFDKSAHTDFIKKQFSENFNLLVGPSARSFSVDYMLEHKRCLPGSELITIKVALVDENPIGFAIYNYGQYYNTMLIPNQNKGGIDIICIDKDFRNKGYASQLLSSTIKELKDQGITTITIGVHNYNETAIRLYKKFGFTFLRSHDTCDDIYQLTISSKS